MVLTRKEAKDAFNHILDEVIGCSDESHLKTSLVFAGIRDIYDLATIDAETINQLTYPDSNDKKICIDVSKGDKSLIRVFGDYIVYHLTNNTPIDDDWTEVTQADFDSFHISSDYQTQLRNGPKTPPPSNTARPSNPFPPPPKFSPADIFRRGIKHDSSLFPTLKDEKLQ